MDKSFLDTAYSLDGPGGARALYDIWAESYDAEIARNGYATPRRCAEALARFCRADDAAVLDFGCGTGLSGLALCAAGFETIDGVDLSVEMLDRAKTKGCYRSLNVIYEGAAPSIKAGDYAAITAVGVFGPGHAPPDTFDTLINSLQPGGLIVLSLNDESLKDPGFEAWIHAHVEIGKARLLHREHGDHLPVVNVGSVVYVIEKL